MNLGNKKLLFQVSLKYFQVFKFHYLKTVQGQNKDRPIQFFDYFVNFLFTISKIFRHPTSW